MKKQSFLVLVMLIFSSTLNFESLQAITWPNPKNILSKGIKGLGVACFCTLLPKLIKNPHKTGLIAGMGLMGAGSYGLILNSQIVKDIKGAFANSISESNNDDSPEDFLKKLKAAGPLANADHSKPKKSSSKSDSVDDGILLVLGVCLSAYSGYSLYQLK